MRCDYRQQINNKQAMSTNSARKSSLIEQPVQKIIVGVAGGSAAGKTTLCENIFRQMAFDRNFKVEIISLDSFYKNVDKTQVKISQYNFDHPNALDFDLAYKTLKNLIESNDKVEIPQYSFIEHARLAEPAFIGPANIIFFQGLMAFHDKRIRDLLTYKIFINCDDDIRLCRRLKRDTNERGRSVISVLEQYNKFVKNAFRDFILPTIVYADIIIPGFRNNRVSVDFIVQHIKNMARRITFKERAVKTKTFIFGESEIYDLQCASGSYENTVIPQQESFLVFPTSNQHKKELQFFLTCLLSQIFSVEYFHQVYKNQFIKILKSLLIQLISLKNFKHENMQIFSIYNLKEILSLQNNQYPIKVVFFPVAEVQHFRNILSTIRGFIRKNPKCTIIILNAFCDLSVPNLIYKEKISNVIMINLFVIANEKRFKEIMTNNITATNHDNFDWFIHNHDIANEGVSTISRQFKIYKRNQQDIAKLNYQNQVNRQQKQMQLKAVDESLQSVGIIQQFNVISQQHQNLCGYHALSTLLSIQSKKDILSRDIFIQNYHLLASIIGQVNYKPLQRHFVKIILTSDLFLQHQNVGQLNFSFKYIQNSEQEIDQLQYLFDKLNQGQMSHIYILLGVVDHYVLLRVTKTKISFYDSINTSLRDIMNGTYNQQQQSGKKPSEADMTRSHNLKEAIEIILDLLEGKKVMSILIEKRIQDIVGSFNLIKDNKAQIQNWFTNEYPKPVIQNDLLKILHTRKLDLTEKHKLLLHNWLNNQSIKSIFTQAERNVS